jgi:hypothetical protein
MDAQYWLDRQEERNHLMDPNEALRLLRKYASDTPGALGEQFEALDEWLSKGGFLPTAWSWSSVPIGPFTVMLCEKCDTEREVDTHTAAGVTTFRVCGHVQGGGS